VRRGGTSLPCLGVADLSPQGAAVLLGAPARPGEALRLVLVNAAGNFGATVVLRVTACTPASDSFLAWGLFSPPLDAGSWELLLG
jgi:hypothetical protein